jgi:hypothetical protein
MQRVGSQGALDTQLITNGYALNQKLNSEYLKGEPGIFCWMALY